MKIKLQPGSMTKSACLWHVAALPRDICPGDTQGGCWFQLVREGEPERLFQYTPQPCRPDRGQCALNTLFWHFQTTGTPGRHGQLPFPGVTKQSGCCSGFTDFPPEAHQHCTQLGAYHFVTMCSGLTDRNAVPCNGRDTSKRVCCSQG